MSTPGIRSYRDLTVWQEAMTLAANIYGLTKSFPRDEVYGMTAQLRRSATSVPANIAEGYGGEAVGSYVQFLKSLAGRSGRLKPTCYLLNALDWLLSLKWSHRSPSVIGLANCCMALYGHYRRMPSMTSQAGAAARCPLPAAPGRC
jgi:four helix bundle protein